MKTEHKSMRASNYPLRFIQSSTHARVTKPPRDVTVVIRRDQNLKENNKKSWVTVVNGIKLIYTTERATILKKCFCFLLCFSPQPEVPGCQFESSVPQDLSALIGKKENSQSSFLCLLILKALTTLSTSPIQVVHEMGVAWWVAGPLQK